MATLAAAAKKHHKCRGRLFRSSRFMSALGPTQTWSNVPPRVS